MPASFRSELEVMVSAVRAAGRICRAVQAELVGEDTLEKQDRSPVTIADLASQSLIARRLHDAFGLPLVAEEEASVLLGEDRTELREGVLGRVRTEWGDADEAAMLAAIDLGRYEGGANGRFFTLGPSDGTKGFLRGVQYAVALALVEDGRLAAAVLGCPNLDGGVLFVAERGGGTRRVPLDGSGVEGASTVHVSERNDPTEIRFCESVESGHTDQGHSAQIAQALGVMADPVRLDSQCKYGVVANGGAELYLRLPTLRRRRALIWDHAAGALAVTEAGGRVTDLDGEDLDFGRGSRLSANRGVVASNGHVHGVVLETIANLGI